MAWIFPRGCHPEERRISAWCALTSLTVMFSHLQKEESSSRLELTDFSSEAEWRDLLV